MAEVSKGGEVEEKFGQAGRQSGLQSYFQYFSFFAKRICSYIISELKN